jgi:hypothetical protein
MFYDFATAHLGEDSWTHKDRFIENHLASEAFAVLALDYHILPHGRKESLASDFNYKDWPNFKKLNSSLPPSPYDSIMVKALTELYLSGNRDPFFKSIPTSTQYQKWVGHEIRYSRKQRGYVCAWFEDLTLQPFSRTQASLNRSFVFEAVEELISTLLYSTKSSWDEFLQAFESKEKLNSKKNFFYHLPKYNKKSLKYDFRFTDVTAFTKEFISIYLARCLDVNTPNPADLFLLWQLISLYPPEKFKSSNLRMIIELAKSSQTQNPNKDSWKKTIQLINDIFKDLSWKTSPDSLSAFFLP